MTQPLSGRMKPLLLVAFAFGLSACNAGETEQMNSESQAPHSVKELHVYKHQKCGCCRKWMNHMEQFEFDLETTNLFDIADIKDEHNIPPNLRSCHTAISPDGYVFEGHIPAKFIEQYLKSPPENSRGLFVPAMPAGSPGMEVGDRFQPYNIVQLNIDGSTHVYARVSTYEEQF